MSCTRGYIPSPCDRRARRESKTRCSDIQPGPAQRSQGLALSTACPATSIAVSRGRGSFGQSPYIAIPVFRPAASAAQASSSEPIAASNPPVAFAGKGSACQSTKSPRLSGRAAYLATSQLVVAHFRLRRIRQQANVATGLLETPREVVCGQIQR